MSETTNKLTSTVSVDFLFYGKNQSKKTLEYNKSYIDFANNFFEVIKEKDFDYDQLLSDIGSEVPVDQNNTQIKFEYEKDRTQYLNNLKEFKNKLDTTTQQEITGVIERLKELKKDGKDVELVLKYTVFTSLNKLLEYEYQSDFNVVLIDKKTPSKERKRIAEEYKKSKQNIVLIEVEDKLKFESTINKSLDYLLHEQIKLNNNKRVFEEEVKKLLLNLDKFYPFNDENKQKFFKSIEELMMTESDVTKRHVSKVAEYFAVIQNKLLFDKIEQSTEDIMNLKDISDKNELIKKKREILENIFGKNFKFRVSFSTSLSNDEDKVLKDLSNEEVELLIFEMTENQLGEMRHSSDEFIIAHKKIEKIFLLKEDPKISESKDFSKDDINKHYKILSNLTDSKKFKKQDAIKYKEAIEFFENLKNKDYLDEEGSQLVKEIIDNSKTVFFEYNFSYFQENVDIFLFQNSLSASLHDVGKYFVSAHLLDSHKKFFEMKNIEIEAVNLHDMVGSELLKKIQEELKDETTETRIFDIVKGAITAADTHHNPPKEDQKGTLIDVTILADLIDALTAPRSYKTGFALFLNETLIEEHLKTIENIKEITGLDIDITQELNILKQDGFDVPETYWKNFNAVVGKIENELKNSNLTQEEISEKNKKIIDQLKKMGDSKDLKTFLANHHGLSQTCKDFVKNNYDVIVYIFVDILEKNMEKDIDFFTNRLSELVYEKERIDREIKNSVISDIGNFEIENEYNHLKKIIEEIETQQYNNSNIMDVTSTIKDELKGFLNEYINGHQPIGPKIIEEYISSDKKVQKEQFKEMLKNQFPQTTMNEAKIEAIIDLLEKRISEFNKIEKKIKDGEIFNYNYKETEEYRELINVVAFLSKENKNNLTEEQENECFELLSMFSELSTVDNNLDITSIQAIHSNGIAFINKKLESNVIHQKIINLKLNKDTIEIQELQYKYKDLLDYSKEVINESDVLKKTVEKHLKNLENTFISLGNNKEDAYSCIQDIIDTLKSKVVIKKQNFADCGTTIQ